MAFDSLAPACQYRRALTTLLALTVFSLSGCGVYINRGGGSYTFIGLGSFAAARRCDPLAQWSGLRPTGYDYPKLQRCLEAK